MSNAVTTGEAFGRTATRPDWQEVLKKAASRSDRRPRRIMDDLSGSIAPERVEALAREAMLTRLLLGLPSRSALHAFRAHQAAMAGAYDPLLLEQAVIAGSSDPVGTRLSLAQLQERPGRPRIDVDLPTCSSRRPLLLG